jgi:hypothetical protein
VPLRKKKRQLRCRTPRLGVEGGLDVGGAVAEEAGGGDGLGEDDTDGDEDGAGAGSKRDGDFDARALFVLIAAAEAEAAFGEIFADSDFFLEAAAADAGEDAGLDARAVAARNDAFFDGGAVRAIFGIADLGLGFDPDGRRVAEAAETRDALANFEGFQLQLVEIDDFAALAEAALHEKAREGFLGFVWGGEVNVPEVGARIENMDGVKEIVGRVLVDFGDDASAGVLPVVAIEMAAEVKFLAHGKFIREAEDAAIAADEQGFGGLRESGAFERDPGGFHGHAEADAVTLAKTIG